MINSQSACSAQIKKNPHEALLNEHMARWEDLLLAEKVFEAIQSIQQFIENYPTIQTPFMGIGNAKQNEGVCLGQEIKWYFQQIERNPLLINPYDLLSQLSCCSEHTTGLINWFNKMLEKYPECYKLRFGLATSLYNSYNHRQAQKKYQGVIKIKPDFVPAYIGLSWMHIFRYYRFSKALQYANIALSLDKNNFHGKMIIAGFIPSFDKSMEILQEIKQTNPNNPLVLCAEAFRLASKGSNKQEIFVLLTKGLSMKNKTVMPYIYLGKGLDYNSQAKIYFQQAITLFPKSPLCYVELGYFYYAEGDNEMALLYIQKSLSIDSSACYPLYLTGCIYRRLKQFDLALEYFSKSVECNPYYMRAYQEKQEIYQRMDRLDDLYTSSKMQLKYMIKMADHVEDEMTLRIIKIINLNKDGCAAVEVIQMLHGATFAEQLCLNVAIKLIKLEMVEDCKIIVNYAETISGNPQIYYFRAQISRLTQEWSAALDNYLRYLESPCQQGTMKQYQWKIPQRSIAIIHLMDSGDNKHQIRTIQSYFPDDFDLCWAVGQYLQNIGQFYEAVKIYTLVVDLSMPSQYQGSLSKWKKMSFGTYSSREKVMLHKEKLAFKLKFYEIFENNKMAK